MTGDGSPVYLLGGSFISHVRSPEFDNGMIGITVELSGMWGLGFYQPAFEHC
jgi:hypothetical protein